MTRSQTELMQTEIACARACLQTAITIAHRYRLLALEQRLKKTEQSLATVQAQLMELVHRNGDSQ